MKYSWNGVSYRCSRQYAAAFALAISGALTSGCATIDHIAPRTSHFNGETSDSKSRSILANILRAADGEPLQFTDITTITGTGDFEGSVSAALPLKVKPSTVERTWSVSPTVTASAGNQFNVANLNTQEFYNGLQEQVKVEHIANFIAAGYDPALVLFLMIDEIEVTSPKRRIVLQADTTAEEGFRAFKQAIDFLLQSGLTTGYKRGAVVGPALSAQEARSPDVLAMVVGDKPSGLSLVETPGRGPAPASTYRLVGKGELGFCFDPLRVADTSFFDTPADRIARWQKVAELPGVRLLEYGALPKTLQVPLIAGDKRQPLPGAFFTISQASFCDPPDGAATEEKLDTLDLRPRSVEGIFQFLGAIARAQMINPQALGLPQGDAPTRFPFRVVAGPPPADAALTIVRRGESYSLIADRDGATDQSTRVLQILTDLLALQSSAKSLPAPNVISVIAR